MLADRGEQAEIARMMPRGTDETFDVGLGLFDAAKRQQRIEDIEANIVPRAFRSEFECLAIGEERLLRVADAGQEGAVAPHRLEVRRRHAARLEVLHGGFRNAAHAEQADAIVQQIADVAAVERHGAREMGLRMLVAALRLDGDAEHVMRRRRKRVLRDEAA